MRNAKELLLATRPFAREQRWRSWWHLLSTIAALAVLLTLAGSSLHWALRLPFSILAGLLLVRFFILFHDQQHGAILKGSRLGGVIMWVFGLLTLNPPSVWRRSHDHHHRHNSKGLSPNIGSYPLITVADYAGSTRWQQFAYQASRHPLTMSLGYLTVFGGCMCLMPLVRNPRRHFDGALSITSHIGVAWLLTNGFVDMLFTWLIPFLVGSAVGSYLFFAQHNFPGVRLQTGARWDYVFSALHSSSYIPMGPVMCWLTGNIGYHHIHHLNAKIPFYRLPEAMRALPELQTPTRTTLSLADIRACLRLKLWDPATRELVAWPQAALAGVPQKSAA